MRNIFLFIFGFFFFQTLSAQEIVEFEEASDSTGIAILDSVQVERDTRLDKMLRWHIEKNRAQEGMEGFRVEIFFSSNLDAKDKALETKAAFLSEYPDYAVHIKFVAPNFRVRVGDFRTKNEAWKLYKKIQNDYPTAFVVPDIINFPLLKSKKYE